MIFHWPLMLVLSCSLCKSCTVLRHLPAGTTDKTSCLLRFDVERHMFEYILLSISFSVVTYVRLGWFGGRRMAELTCKLQKRFET